MEPYFTRAFLSRIYWLLIATGFAFLAARRWAWPTWWWFIPGAVLLFLIIARAIQQGTNNVARKAREMND